MIISAASFRWVEVRVHPVPDRPYNNFMTSRILLAFAAAALVSFASVVTWRDLRTHEREQIARIAEAESYAARSRLVRNVNDMLQALRDVHIYWSTFGAIPRDLWPDEASIQLQNFAGLKLVFWDEPGRGIRYARIPTRPVLDYSPDDAQWARYGYLREKAEGLKSDGVLGPFEGSDGRVELEIVLVPKANRVDGTLIAVVNPRTAIDHLIGQDSPGFAVTVKAGEVVLYQRGEPAAGIPDEWTRKGMIENSLGTVWEVVHAPTADLADSMRTPAINAVLYAGLAIAVLVGLLLIESGRANIRARDALLAQAELKELNLSLEEQVAERTRELKERSRDLVTVTDSVGHDLRNPLNSISANIQLLDQQYSGPLGREGVEILAKLSSGVGQMIEILDRLLNLSALSQTAFHREPLKMTQLAEEIFEELVDMDHGPPVDFFAETVPDAMGEPMLVQTLLMNLFANALKYSRSKQNRKVIFGHRRVDGELAYYVEDNGIGFDSEEADRMFAAFERLPGGEQAEGLGLGLDIANRVVQRHRGRLWARGAPGRGATFYFTLGGSAPND